MKGCEGMLSFLEKKRERVEEALRKVLPSKEEGPSPLIEAMHYSVMSGGKRLRPILLLETAGLFNVGMEKVLPIACGVEVLHSYSLVHDDLPCMDDDDLRRGQPTLHRVYGEEMAVLTGDALLTFAFELITSAPISPMLKVELVKDLSQASGYKGMVAGQVEDLLAEGESIEMDRLSRIHNLKTGALITFSVRAGALVGEAAEEELTQLTSFGEDLGLLFQITDDILDVVGETKVMGKEKGSDEGSEKATFPQVLGLSKSRELAYSLKKRASDALKIFGMRGDHLLQITQYILERER